MGEDGGINLYGYVANNPINLIDPLGLDPCDCAKLKARIGLLNQEFNSGTAALRDQLNFQYDSALTLYGIDRAIDTASGVTGGAVGSAVKGAVLARGAAAASGTLVGQLAQNGMLTRVGTTAVGRAMNAGEAWAKFGVYGTVAGGVTKQAVKIPGRIGTNGVRDQIQNTADSLDAYLSGLAGTLSGLRRQYQSNCGGQ